VTASKTTFLLVSATIVLLYFCTLILLFEMPVGLLTLELRLPDAHSLKDKRQILRSLKDRLRRKFNIAIAEMDFHDVWQSSIIGIVTLSNAEQHVEESLQHVLREAERLLGPILVDHSVDFL
jgi:uncharacterized protein YlxP (DUF503 family)